MIWMKLSIFKSYVHPSVLLLHQNPVVSVQKQGQIVLLSQKSSILIHHLDRSSNSAGDSKCTSFKLPVFSPDVQKCISNDAFYTPTQSNRLIKQSCVALRGYCWERGNPVSNSDKETLAKKLYELAPKTLGNPGSAKKSPYVSMYISLSYTNINNDYNLYLVG